MTTSLEQKIASFWYDDGDAVVGASTGELDEAERRIGFQLPFELRQLLQLRAGGVSNYHLFGEVLFSPVRAVGKKYPLEDLVELYLKGGVETLPPNVVIFASDADAWFGLDYRANRECPSVLHWSEYLEEPVQLAPTFREFLDGLSDSPTRPQD